MDLSTFLDQLEDDIEGYATQLSAESDSLRVTYEFSSLHGPLDDSQHVQLTFTGVIECNLRAGFIGCPSVHSSHPLLLEHVEPTDDLFFSVRPINPAEIVGMLHQIHFQALGAWRPLARYLVSRPDRLASGNGLLARGPRSLIAQFNEAIADPLGTTVIQGPQRAFSSILAVVFDQFSHYVVCSSVQVTA